MTTVSTQKDDRQIMSGRFARILRRPEVGAAVAALLIFTYFSSTTTAFLSTAGVSTWLYSSSLFGVLAVAGALLMIGGEFDLSSGVLVGTTGLLIGMLVTNVGLDIWSSIAIALAFAALVGLINGYVVIKTKLPSFIVTLATFFVLKGANMAFTKMMTGSVRVTGTEKAPGFDTAAAIFASKFGPEGFQISLVWWLVITIIATFVLTRTRFGNWIYAVGGDANAARNAGVPVDRTKIWLFVITSLSAALVGIMFVLRLKGMQAGQGVGQEFYYIIAAAVGGTLLTGGAGSAIGASIGALIMGMAYIGIPYSRWDSDWTATFLGIILFTAVMINTYIGRKAKGGKK